MIRKIIIPFVFSSLLIISCGDSSQKEVSYNNLNVEEVAALLKSNTNIVIIDVRTPEEIAESGFIENSINIDFKASDFREKISALDKNKEYILFCRSGNRSGQAAQLMTELGFTNINNLNNAGYEEFAKALTN